MDAITPGGVSKDLTGTAGESLAAHLARIEREVATLKSIYDEHAGTQDRFIMTGQVTPELAERIGLTGLAARASGIARDLRVDYPIPPYEQLDPRTASHTRGDVAARVAVRFDEIFESMRLVQTLVQQLPPGGIRAPVGVARAGARGLGWVEGWRGEVLVALETAAANRIHRVHPHDPSWQNWPLLEHAVHGNIVPDFPLINKSFNLSYSGTDL
jgi:Ni,Fe-hydrogenase III large subunit